MEAWQDVHGTRCTNNPLTSRSKRLGGSIAGLRAFGVGLGIFNLD